MKNLTKIFMTVAVSLFAFSCTTDSTEDLGVKLEGQGGTEIVLSLEESRTQLGVKADGLYPVYWSEGDKISVNGVESSEAVIGSNPATATFAVNVVADKLCVAYPAAAEGEVLFAEKQNHVVEGNTFANGVAAMYGVGTSEGAIKLNHLTGVLKIGVTGSAVLSKAQISTIDRAPIAGAFDIDFESGELTATATSKDVIEYSFGEGLQLSGEAQYIHVAVPAGKYDELYITLYEKGNSGNIMYATVKAGDAKPLVAGNVREFSGSILYAPNAQLYVIDSVEKLQAFKAAIESEDGLTSDAILTEDIDMTGVEWTPIEGYAGTINGNGYAIKGLTAPLFGNTHASFKGLHLEDINITTNDRPICGALACEITATDAASPKVENCSVSGTFTVKNEAYAPTSSGTVAYAALVGKCCGVVFDGCVNHASVEIAKTQSNTTSLSAYNGGLVGFMTPYTKGDKSVLYSEVYNSKNYGAVTLKCVISNNAYLGGVVGCSGDTNYDVKIISCENHGAISADSGASTAKNLSIGGVCGYMLGSRGNALTEYNLNDASIAIKGDAVINGELQLGGLIGNGKSVHINNSVNNGLVLVESTTKIGAANVGGILGVGLLQTVDGTKRSFTINNDVNNGEVKFGGSNLTATSTNATRIGGISGYTQGGLNSTVNNGKITIFGTRNANGTIGNEGNDYKNGTYVIAGLVGYKTEGKITDSQNHGDIEIAGTLKELHATNKTQWKIAGIVGYLSTDPVGTCVADGEIIVSGTIEGEANIGVMVAFTYNSTSSETCATNITIKKGAVLSGGAIIGGVLSWTFTAPGTLTYTGTIKIEEGATIGTKCYIGGCVGSHIGTSKTARTLKNYTNDGYIINNGNLTNGGFIGGCVGYIAKAGDVTDAVFASIDNAVNNKPIVCGPTSVTTGTNLYVSGVACHAAVSTNLTNNGKITIDGSHTGGNNYFAGCIADGIGDATGLTNNADIECPATAKFKVARIGGVMGYSSSNVSGTNLGCINYSATSTGTTSIGGVAYRGIVIDCVNGVEGDATKGVINYNGASGSSATSASLNFGGVVADPEGNCSNSTNYAPINVGGSMSHTLYGGGLSYSAVNGGKTMTNCQNYGKITVTAAIGIPGDANRKGADCFIGGFAYSVPASESMRTYINCHNYGDIELTPEAKIAGAIRMGGMFANIEEDTASVTLDGCSNTGDIKVSCQNSLGESSNFYVAGCIASISKKSNIVVKNGLVNAGDLTVDGGNKTAAVHMAGLIGSIASAVTTDLSGNLVNTGNFLFSGNTKTYLRIGGVVCVHSAASFTAPMISTGNITVTGTCDLTSASTQIGGITAAHANPIANAQYYGNIKAIGYPCVGMITGKLYAEGIEAKDCAIGGTVTIDEFEDNDPSGELIMLPNVQTVDASNVHKFIYGQPVEESIATSNNVTVLTSAPSTEQPAPEPTPEETPAA